VERRKNRPEITRPFNVLGGERVAIWERLGENGNPSISRLTSRLIHLDSILIRCLNDTEISRALL
jgi:hypothetical protein